MEPKYIQTRKDRAKEKARLKKYHSTYARKSRENYGAKAQELERKAKLARRDSWLAHARLCFNENNVAGWLDALKEAANHGKVTRRHVQATIAYFIYEQKLDAEMRLAWELSGISDEQQELINAELRAKWQAAEDERRSHLWDIISAQPQAVRTFEEMYQESHTQELQA